MAISHLLEDFGTNSDLPGPLTMMSPEDIEDVRLGAFEQGYSAGWEDALSAQSRDRARLSETLAGNLEDLSFTYHEAASHLTQSVEPVFRGLLDLVLPETMTRVFGQHVIDQLMQLVRDAVDQPVQISVTADMTDMVASLLPAALSLPVQVVEDPKLETGQAALRVGHVEKSLDMTRVLGSVSDAVDAFFYQANKEAQNG